MNNMDRNLRKRMDCPRKWPAGLLVVFGSFCLGGYTAHAVPREHSAAAEDFQIPRGEEVVDESWSPGVGETPATIARDWNFLIEQMTVAGIGRPTILAALVVVAPRSIVSKEEFDKLFLNSPWPSVRDEICWQGSLETIADNLRLQHSSNDADAGADAVKDDPRSNEPIGPIVRVPVWAGMVLALKRFKSGLDELDEFELSCSHRAVVDAPAIMRWDRPVRIASTSDDKLDALIAQALEEIRREVPDAPVDDRSFPASPEVQNLFFARDRDRSLVRSTWGIENCAPQQSCRSIEQLAMPSDDMHSPPDPERSALFLDKMHFSRPVTASFPGPVALIERGDRGQIMAAICGKPYRGDASFQFAITKSCLAQAMGARVWLYGEKPGRMVEQELLVLASAMNQLKTIYAERYPLLGDRRRSFKRPKLRRKAAISFK